MKPAPDDAELRPASTIDFGLGGAEPARPVGPAAVAESPAERETTVTDWVAGFVVTLEAELHQDHAQATLDAIRQLRGVVAVEPVRGTPGITVARAQARGELLALLSNALDAYV